jgi:hypothetical protein
VRIRRCGVQMDCTCLKACSMELWCERCFCAAFSFQGELSAYDGRAMQFIVGGCCQIIGHSRAWCVPCTGGQQLGVDVWSHI